MAKGPIRVKFFSDMVFLNINATRESRWTKASKKDPLSNLFSMTQIYSFCRLGSVKEIPMQLTSIELHSTPRIAPSFGMAKVGVQKSSSARVFTNQSHC
jgi:hypothetical protein